MSKPRIEKEVMALELIQCSRITKQTIIDDIQRKHSLTAGSVALNYILQPGIVVFKTTLMTGDLVPIQIKMFTSETRHSPLLIKTMQRSKSTKSNH